MALGVKILALAALTYAFRVAGHAGNLGELINTLKEVGGGWRRLYLESSFSFMIDLRLRSFAAAALP
jgi:hypothetical protein